MAVANTIGAIRRERGAVGGEWRGLEILATIKMREGALFRGQIDGCTIGSITRSIA